MFNRSAAIARRVGLVTVVVAVLALAPSAIAAPVAEVHGGDAAQARAQLGNNDVVDEPAGAQASNSSRADGEGSPVLTGTDLALMLGGALVVLALGASLGRLSPRTQR